MKMYLLINIVVLLFEVIYYSLFMKFARKEGKLWRYLLLFTLITLFFSFIGTNQIYSYLILTIMILYGLKIICKLKVSLFDLLFIFIMMLVKIAIEGISCLLIYNLFDKFTFTLIIDCLKFAFVFIFNEKLSYFYNFLKNKWDNNNFYIRYIFNILFFAFIIMSFVFMIIK